MISDYNAYRRWCEDLQDNDDIFEVWKRFRANPETLHRLILKALDKNGADQVESIVEGDIPNVSSYLRGIVPQLLADGKPKTIIELRNACWDLKPNLTDFKKKITAQAINSVCAYLLNGHPSPIIQDDSKRVAVYRTNSNKVGP